jgi:hypothetical protein
MFCFFFLSMLCLRSFSVCRLKSVSLVSLLPPKQDRECQDEARLWFSAWGTDLVLELRLFSSHFDTWKVYCCEDGQTKIAEDQSQTTKTHNPTTDHHGKKQTLEGRTHLKQLSHDPR